jgi:hypothetical protein
MPNTSAIWSSFSSDVGVDLKLRSTSRRLYDPALEALRVPEVYDLDIVKKLNQIGYYKIGR